MRLSEHISFENSKQFQPIFLDYINQTETLKDFYNFFPTLENFEKQISLKNFSVSKRQLLVEALHKQYDGVANPPKDTINLLLKPTTFTITTGHQLNIYTGTLYFHYKIQTVIRAAQELKQKYPDVRSTVMPPPLTRK